VHVCWVSFDQYTASLWYKEKEHNTAGA
jgi:hypothetical protein